MFDIFNEDEKGSVIKLTDLSKSHLISLAHTVVQNVHDGNADPIDEFLKAKALSEVCDAITDSLKEDVKEEWTKYNRDDKYRGCTIAVKNQADSYDFSHDAEWQSLSSELERIKAQMKDREKKMIDAMKYAELVDENGEIIPAARVKKFGGTILSVALPK